MTKTCLIEATAHSLCFPLFRNPNIEQKIFDAAYTNIYLALCDHIGHDGSERGFHTQEIQDALRELKVLLIRHESCPMMQLPAEVSEQGIRRPVVMIYPEDKLSEIFLPKLNRNNGVLVVRKSEGLHHALAFQSGSNTAYDVDKEEFIPLEDLDIVMFLELIPYEDHSAEQGPEEVGIGEQSGVPTQEVSE